MLSRPEFDSKELDPVLLKRMQQAVQDGRIKCFNLREGPADGDQDLDLWTRELEDVVREIMEDPVFKDVYTSIYTDIHCCCAQDTVVVVPPYPYCQCIEEDRLDVDLEDCWYARPQLFFMCSLAFASKAWKSAKERYLQSWTRYIHVYTCV